MATITLKQMLEAGVHFGHRRRYWNPKMKNYIYRDYQKLSIINLDKTLPMFETAMNFLAEIASKRGRIMFVGTKYAARSIVREEAIRSGMPYVDQRWLGGMLTNYKTIRQSVKQLKSLEALLEDQQKMSALTKKEGLKLTRQKDKLESSLSGIKNMGGLPDALFVIDIRQENIAIKEAKCLGIPVVGIVDTNADPDVVDYMIPGNDDSFSAIRLYCATLADIIIEQRGIIDLAQAKEKASKAKTAEKDEKTPVVKKVVRKVKVVAEAEAPAKAAPAKAAPAKAAAAKTKLADPKQAQGDKS